jgi:hypothetical protein
MNFNVPGEMPGNLAGGIGKDQKTNAVGANPSPQDDERIVNGSVVISDTGSSRLRPRKNSRKKNQRAW